MNQSPQQHARLAAELNASLGECPTWDPSRKRLFSVDITEQKIHAFDPITKNVETQTFDEWTCAIGAYPDGRLIVAFAKRLAWLDWESGDTTTICEVEADKPGNRCNDGKIDPSGRFWIGTMSNDASEVGSGTLYRLDGNRLTPVLHDLTISNGMDWSSDQKTMFFIDSPSREIWAFDFDASDSSIHNQRTAITIPDQLGIPDGLCVAKDNTIWVALWGGNCISHWDPSSGDLIEIVETSCPHTTSCALDNSDTLYITTSRLDLSPEALSKSPQSGSLFAHSPTY